MSVYANPVTGDKRRVEVLNERQEKVSCCLSSVCLSKDPIRVSSVTNRPGNNWLNHTLVPTPETFTFIVVTLGTMANVKAKHAIDEGKQVPCLWLYKWSRMNTYSMQSSPKGQSLLCYINAITKDGTESWIPLAWLAHFKSSLWWCTLKAVIVTEELVTTKDELESLLLSPFVYLLSS